MKIGLFFGSFNPIHTGHLMLANFIRETTDLRQVWLVISPHNPLKEKKNLLNEYDRLHLIRLAIENNYNLRACSIEFNLPQPNYTIDTLTYLHEKYPQHEFCLIMGSDNLLSLHKWKNYEQILKYYSIYVYKRRGSEQNPFPDCRNIIWMDFPFIDISASFIREQIRAGVSMEYFVPERVWEYIRDNRLYRD
ncbi:MAG: nicotinate (nicotinamide) nucleotide adenylyltransferase [Chitinophagales bacterium]|nr:nicotinate (nicotinamide) nucleotide adenylyltransferase [Chitinophagales bacterium]